MIFNVFSGYDMSVGAIYPSQAFLCGSFKPKEACVLNNHQSKLEPFSTTTIHFTPSPLKSSSSRGFMATRNTCSYTSKVQLHQSFVIRKAIDADTW